jgi:hypothetical protein
MWLFIVSRACYWLLHVDSCSAGSSSATAAAALSVSTTTPSHHVCQDGILRLDSSELTCEQLGFTMTRMLHPCMTPHQAQLGKQTAAVEVCAACEHTAAHLHRTD